MNKFVLSLFLVTSSFASAFNTADHIDLTTSTARNMRVSVGETFMITSFQGFRGVPGESIPWRLGSYSPFELIFEGWNEGCIKSIMAANTQIWRFKATQAGTYEIEFWRPRQSPMQAIQIEKISVEVH